jgi:hypothetical protein
MSTRKKSKKWGVYKDGRQVVTHVVQPCVTLSNVVEYYNVKLALRAAGWRHGRADNNAASSPYLR